MNTKDFDEIFGKQLRQLKIDDFGKRTFNTNRYMKNGL